MAHFTKDIYDKKREWAANRMAANKEIDTLTEEQHNALANLASIRHKLHSNMQSVIISDEQYIKKDIINANIMLNEADLDGVSSIPIDTTDYIDIDTFDLLAEIEQIPEHDTKEYDVWYDMNYNRIYSELEELNKKIENYLLEIDEKYGTNYAPSGASRIFDEGGSINKNNILLAPNGNPSNLTPKQWHLVRTPAFKKWFGDWINSPETASKVVDENGEPLIVFHGTKNKFNIFKPSVDGDIFFAEKKELASLYGNVKPFYINAKKIDTIIHTKNKWWKDKYALVVEAIKSMTEKNIYDCILLKETADPPYYEENKKQIYSDIYIVKNSNQIKLADGSNTTFDINNNDIRFDEGGDIKTQNMKNCEIKKAYTAKQIAKKYNISEKEANKLLVVAQSVEMEHTDCPKEARKIASHHIFQEGIEYYTKLKAMEKTLETGGVVKDEKYWENIYNENIDVENRIEFDTNDKGKEFGKATFISPKYIAIAEYCIAVLKQKGYEADYTKAASGTIYVRKNGIGSDSTIRISDHIGRGGVFSVHYDISTLHEAKSVLDKIKTKAEYEEIELKERAIRDKEFELINKLYTELKEKGLGYKESNRTYITTKQFIIKHPKISFVKTEKLNGGAFNHEYITDLDEYSKIPTYQYTVWYYEQNKNTETMETGGTTNEGRKGGLLEGDAHSAPSGGMKAIVTDAGNKPVLLEGSEVIINKKSAQCTDCTHTFDGKEMSNKEILSSINTEKGGVPILEQGAEIKTESTEITPAEAKENKYKLGEYVVMFEDEPPLKVVYVNEWSDKPATYDLRCDKGKIYRQNIPENKILRLYEKPVEPETLNNDAILELGGGIKEEIAKTKLIADSPESDYNKKIPMANRIPKFPIRKTFTFNPKDKNFISLVSDFVGEGELKPLMAGVYFDKEKQQITATNAHILVKFDVQHKFQGIYNINYIPEEDGIKMRDKKPVMIEGKYPNYEGVIPLYPPITSMLDVKKCLAFIQYVDNSKFLNREAGNPMAFLHEDLLNDNYSPYITLNAIFFETILKLFLKLGITEVEIGLSSLNRAITFIADKDNYKVTALLMPIMCKDVRMGEIERACETGRYGDIDFDNFIQANYDLKNNVVVSNDRTYIDYVDINTKKEDVAEFNSDELSVMKAFLKQKYALPILETFEIINKKLHFTDLENSVIIDGVNKPDGIYQLRGDSLFITDNKMDEFPIVKNDLSYYNYIGSIDALELKAKLLIAKDFMSDDEYRPDLSAIHLFNTNNNTFIAATDGHIFYTDKIETGALELKENEVILIPELFKNLERLMHDCEVKIYNNETNVIFICGKYTYVSRKIDQSTYNANNLKRFYEKNIIEEKVEYFDCINIDKKDLKEIFDFAEGIKKQDKNKAVFFKVDIEKKKIILLDDDDIELCLEKNISLSSDNGIFETGIFLMPKIGNEIFNISILKTALTHYEAEEFTFCKLSFQNSLYIPAPKIEGLVVGDEHKEKIKQQVEAVSEIAEVQQAEALKEVEEPTEDIEKKVADYKARISLIKEMIEWEIDKETIEKLIIRGELLVEMVQQYESDYFVIFKVEEVKDVNKKCEIGEVSTSLSNVVDGKVIKSTDKVILAFDNAKALKDYLESDNIVEKSSNNSQTNNRYSFFIPIWHIDKNGNKLWFNYNNVSDCPFEFVTIKQETIDVKKPLTKELNKKLLATIGEVSIYTINGDYVRKTAFLDYTMGGHWYVSGDYKFIPEGEIWIDENLADKENDLKATVLHELIERKLMKGEGMSYEDAHKLASKKELAYRNNATNVDWTELGVMADNFAEFKEIKKHSNFWQNTPESAKVLTEETPERPDTLKRTTKYYKIHTTSLAKYLEFLKELKKYTESVKLFSAGIGEEYLIVTGDYDKEAAMHPSISWTDYDDVISDSKNIESYKRLNSKPTPEQKWQGKWIDIDEQIKKIESVLSED